MAEKKTKNLSIYLIKETFRQPEEIVQREGCRPPIEITIEGSQRGLLFIKDTAPRPPRWAHLFNDWLNIDTLAVPGVAGLLIVRVKERLFAVAFGQGGRFLLRDDVYEGRFGLLCALNSIAPETFRCVDIQSMDAIQSQKRVQAGQEATPDQFGLDVEQDLLKAIVGTPKNPELGSRMMGGDALAVSVKLELEDLPRLLDAYRTQYERELDSATSPRI